LKNIGPIHHCEPPHANSPDVASGTVASRLRIDVHDANDNDDDNNAWQRGPLWPHGMGPIRANTVHIQDGSNPMQGTSLVCPRGVRGATRLAEDLGSKYCVIVVCHEYSSTRRHRTHPTENRMAQIGLMGSPQANIVWTSTMIAVFENTYFTFFSDFKKTWLFTFCWNNVSKSR